MPLLRERIHLTPHRTCHLKEKIKSFELSFEQRCHNKSDAGGKDILDKVTAHVQNAAEAAFKRSKQLQINKLSSLQGRKHSENLYLYHRQHYVRRIKME